MLFLHLSNIFPRTDHKSLDTSRWLEALWEPSAGIFVLPGGLDMLDISGDGDARLICADLGAIESDSTKVLYFLIKQKIIQQLFIYYLSSLIFWRKFVNI